MRQDPGWKAGAGKRRAAPASPANAWMTGNPGSISGDRPFWIGIRQAVPQPSRMFSGVVLAAQYQA